MAILVIDDRREARLLIQVFLESGGFQDVLTAPSAEMAFEILGISPESEGGGTPVELILMDIVMDGISGVEACRQIKSHPAVADVPVVIMTAYTNPAYIDAAFEAGAIEFLVKPIKKMELLARVRSIMHFNEELNKLREREKKLTGITDELKNANIKLERLSKSDGLTGIPNRRYFDYMLKKLVASAIRLSVPISLLMLDIDCFKAYNDNYGHMAGDDALRTLAGVLHTTIKRESDFIARYGGEEFAIVLFGTQLEAAAVLAETIRKRVEALDIRHQFSDISDRITVSIGIAACTPEPRITPDILINCADRALYEAKNTGKNCIINFDPTRPDYSAPPCSQLKLIMK